MWTTAGIPVSHGNAGSPAVANGVLYIANGTLYAFDATGSTGCTGTPAVCAPLWTSVLSSRQNGSGPAVADGVVYVNSRDLGLQAFDAAGVTNCSPLTRQIQNSLFSNGC